MGLQTRARRNSRVTSNPSIPGSMMEFDGELESISAVVGNSHAEKLLGQRLLQQVRHAFLVFDNEDSHHSEPLSSFPWRWVECSGPRVTA